MILSRQSRQEVAVFMHSSCSSEYLASAISVQHWVCRSWTSDLPLQKHLHRRSADIGIFGNLIHQGHQMAKHVSISVRKKRGYSGRLHFGFEEIELDETGVDVFTSQVSDAVFEERTDFRLWRCQ